MKQRTYDEWLELNELCEEDHICDWCHGTGLVRCDNCGGSGECTCDCCGTVHECSNCHGDGEIDCEYCNGNGNTLRMKYQKQLTLDKKRAITWGMR